MSNKRKYCDEFELQVIQLYIGLNNITQII